MSTPHRRVALITGGSRGLGSGLAEQLAADGFNLVINGRRAEEEISGTLERLRVVGSQSNTCKQTSPTLKADKR